MLALFAACGVAACAESSKPLVREVVEAVRVADVAYGGGHGGSPNGGARAKTYEVNPRDLLSIPDSNDIEAVDLKNGSSMAASGMELDDVRSAVRAIEELGDCGFVFVNLNDGRGLAYNAGEAMYVASAAKAPFICYLLEESGLSDDEKSVVWYIIVESDNDSFEALYEAHMGGGYPNWMSSFGVVHDDYYGNYYPSMSARSLAAVWAEILRFTQGGTEDGQWFGDLLSQTDTSFIRDGLWDTGAEVMNKGGWIVEYGGEPSAFEEGSFYGSTYLSVTDAGIIEADGNTYLMAIVTSQPDEGTTEANVSVLARALFDQRDSL